MDIPRPKYLEELVSRRGSDMVKIVTGIRRCGKSHLVFKAFRGYLREQGVPDENVIELSLDYRDSMPLRDPDNALAHILPRLKATSGERYALIDEVQLMDDFVGVLNELAAIPGVDCYVTGSNSRLLSHDVITEFRGRGDEIRLHPLSFAEFMQTRSDSPSEAWLDYVVYGGLPYVATLTDDARKSAYLTSLFEETYIRDIVERNGLRKTQELENLIDVLASSAGSLVSTPKIQATFKSELRSDISINTVKSYLDCLEDAFLVNRAKRYNVKGRRYIGTPEKFYFEDIGLRNARLGFRQVEQTHLMENVIYNELRVRGFSVDIGVVHKRWRDKEGVEHQSTLEVDFVANMGSRRYYIQSAYAIPDREKHEQEIASLLNVGDEFKKVVVLRDPMKATHDEHGILFLSLFDFLLDEGSLDW